MMRARFPLLVVLALCAVLAACGRGKAADGAKGSDSKDKDSASTVIPVEAGVVAKAPISASYSGTASLEPDREAQVVAKTSGVLLKLHVEEGMHVKSGQVLAELDPDKPKLQVAQAEANLRRLEHDYQRSQEMFSKKLVSSEANEKVQFDLETQRAAYELARLDLNYTNITAPIDGVISERLVKEGNLIQLHQTLFRIDDFDPLLAILNVPERELMTLKPGLVAEMEVDALPKTRFQGKVARISPVVDAKTGTFRVTCEFSDRSGQLKSGMFGRVEIVFDRRAEALTIPRTALIDEDGQTSVFVVEMGKAVVKDSGDKKKDGADKAAAAKAAPAEEKLVLVAHRRPIKIGYVSGEKVEVREGLKDGERVVTVGRAALRDGTQVQVLESKP
jgi:membrane fusion protein (multidrug efflux system)